MRRTEPDASLTLDSDAIPRAAEALMNLNRRHHVCVFWMEDDICTVCWAHAGDVIRAAEGLRLCGRCNGGGMIAPGDCCPECGGHGLAVAAEPTQPDPQTS